MDYDNKESKLLLSKILDKQTAMKQRNQIEHTDFLDMAQQTFIESFLKKIQEKQFQFCGGHKEAQRKILYFYPEKLEKQVEENNIKENQFLTAIRIQLPKEKIGEYEHRIYLRSTYETRDKKRKNRRYSSRRQWSRYHYKKRNYKICII